MTTILKLSLLTLLLLSSNVMYSANQKQPELNVNFYIYFCPIPENYEKKIQPKDL